MTADCRACLGTGEYWYDKGRTDDEIDAGVSWSESMGETPCPICTGTKEITASVGTLEYLATEYIREMASSREESVDYAERLSSLFAEALSRSETRVTIKATDEMYEEWEAFLEDSEP